MGRPRRHWEPKTCERCASPYHKLTKYSPAQWEAKRFCSRSCGNWTRYASKDDPRILRIAAAASRRNLGSTGWNTGRTKADHPSLQRVSDALTGRKGPPSNEAQRQALARSGLWCKGKTKADTPSLAARGLKVGAALRGRANPAQSARMRARYAEHPHLHPNAIVARKTKGHGFTHIERVVADLLKRLGIEFEFNVRVGNRWPDFKIEAAGLLIEADGEYWHQDPAREAERDAYLEGLGWRVLHLAGKQIVNRPDECERLILEAMNHGELRRSA